MTNSYHHYDLKAELIREGLNILDNDGYKGLSLRKVAKACNVSQTAPYRHFKNKDELINAIAVQALTAFNDCLEQSVINNPDDPKKQLKEMGLAYVKFFADNPQYLRLLFFSDITLTPNNEIPDPENHMSPGHPFMVLYDTVERYKKAYPDESLGQQDMVLFSWGFVHGISILITTGQLPPDIDGLESVKRIIGSDKF